MSRALYLVGKRHHRHFNLRSHNVLCYIYELCIMDCTFSFGGNGGDNGWREPGLVQQAFT